MGKSGSMVVEELGRDQDDALAEIRRSRRKGFNQPRAALKRIADGPKAPGDGYWRTPGAFLRAVKSIGQGDWRANKEMHDYVTKALPTGMGEVIGSDGGYLVPPEFSNQLLMRTYENDLLSRTTMFPTSSNMLRIPAINETSRANGSRFGGVQAYWRSEAGTITASKPSLAVIELKPDSLTLAMYATQELLDDATSLESWLDLIADQELAFRIGDALVNGDGNTKPQGLLNAPSKVTVSKEVGQSGGTILSENVLGMWGRLHPSCRANAVWLADLSVEAALPKMTLGTAGAQLVSYLPQGGLSTPLYGTLMGKPVIVTEFNATLGTVGDLILCDPATMVAATRGGTEMAVSMHVAFLTAEQVFRWILRVDARSWWLNPLTPKSGGATQSNIVVLETRS